MSLVFRKRIAERRGAARPFGRIRSDVAKTPWPPGNSVCEVWAEHTYPPAGFRTLGRTAHVSRNRRADRMNSNSEAPSKVLSFAGGINEKSQTVANILADTLPDFSEYKNPDFAEICW